MLSLDSGHRHNFATLHRNLKTSVCLFLVSAIQCCGCYTLYHFIRAVPIRSLMLRTFYACTMFL